MSRPKRNFGIELTLSILNLIPPRVRPMFLAMASAFLLGLLTGILQFRRPQPTLERATITIDFSQDISGQLENLKGRYRNSVIFLSGSLTPSDDQKLSPLTRDNSCISLMDRSVLNMDMYPIESAIKLFRDRKFTSGDIKIVIVQPRPKLIGTECLSFPER